MAGSKNRPAWPIAPGIANANQPREITLISGEDELEMEKNRISVAEAAGLKHVDITIGEQADIYGQGFNDSAWSGSLRPTGHKMGKGGKANEPPPPPKTITVMAGSKNRPAWPIAPGIANANQPRQITLISGEDEQEWEKNRLSVAEAAGLKHVDITIGDQADIYGQGYNGDSAWSGSLRPTGHKMGKGGKGQDQQDGKNPWEGSLRHVNPNAQKKKKKKEEEDDMYGNAPWMGTLRHVKNVNPVYQSIPFKSKTYPDEMAPNPYESMQGKNAKPVYPLTPAAVIPAGGSSAEATKMRQQNEEVERITSGLRETRSLSGTLLKALMPKLLKEHESKYEPLGHDETFHIMEEILSMQMGIDDNSYKKYL